MRFYRALLLLYPASFRAEYGEEMCGIFRHRLRDASGLVAVLALLFESAAETACNAAAVHVDILCQDLRYASRTLRRDSGFTLTAVLVTSLGIGASTASFSLADPVLIRRPPFPDAGRLLRLWETRSGMPAFEVSPADYRDWKRTSRAFEGMGCFHAVAANLAGAGDPERVHGAEVTADLLPILSAQPVAGRLFTAGDERPDVPGILIRDDLAARIGGRFDSLGKRILLDGTPYAVVGVLASDFRFPGNDTAFWRPMQFSEEDFAFRDDRRLQVMAKLRRAVTITAARAELSAIAQEIERRYPRENKGIGARATELAFDIEPRTKLLIVALLGAAFCVLLTACANLANLILARALIRRKEMAVRIAIGGGRQRLVRQLMTESLFLAFLGGSVGVIGATRAEPILARLIPGTLPVSVAIDWRVMLFAALATAVTGLGFGVIPALRVAAGAEKSSLRESFETGSRAERVRSALVVAEVAGSLVLLVASGLLLETLWKLRSVAPGFQADQVVTMRTALPMPRYASSARREQFYTRVLAGIRQLPKVSEAGYVSFLPMMMRGGMWPVRLADQHHDSGMAIVRFVTPGFFETLRIPILHGRDLSESDTRDQPLAAVVSESFARHYWRLADPLGRRFQFGVQERLVIGIAGDIRTRGIEAESEPQVYLPYQQVPDGAGLFWAPKDLVIRTAVAPGALAAQVREVIHVVDPEQPVSDVRSLSGIVDAETAPRVIQAGVVVTFAAISIVVAAMGICGFLSFVVSQRAREIGIRIALGAQPNEIFGAVLRRGLVLGGLGIAVGAAVAVIVARTMRALLWGVGPADPLAISTAMALTLAMILVGTVLPATRAARVDPIAQIRSE